MNEPSLACIEHLLLQYVCGVLDGWIINGKGRLLEDEPPSPELSPRLCPQQVSGDDGMGRNPSLP